VTRAPQFVLTEFEIFPPQRVAHFPFVNSLGQLAGEVGVHPLVDDHVRAEVAEVEARRRADARDALAA